MWLIRSAIVLLGIIGVLWVGMNNADQTVDFSFFTKSYPNLSLNLLLFLVFAAGMVFAFLIFVFSEFQLRHAISRKQRDVIRLERELAALRNLPLEQSEGEDHETSVSL